MIRHVSTLFGFNESTLQVIDASALNLLELLIEIKHIHNTLGIASHNFGSLLIPLALIDGLLLPTDLIM